MPVRFILGRAGTGKTHRCFEQIEQWTTRHGLASRVIFVLPRQATFIAERQLVARRPGRSLLGVRLVSPESLAREIAPQLAESLDLVDSRGRRLLIAMAIGQCAEQLQHFRQARRHPHLPERIDAALTEIEQSGASIADISRALGGDSSPTQAKLADLSLIHETYLKLLGDRLDPQRLQEKVIDAIHTSPLIPGSLVLVDGFADFSRLQRQMLIALAERAAQTEIALLLDSPDPHGDDSIFHRTWRTFSTLSSELRDANIPLDPPLLLNTTRRFLSPALAAIEAEFESAAKSIAPAGTDVKLIEAASELEEVRAVARQIRRWRLEGVRLSQIGILCRDLEPYAQWIRPIFAEHDIACFIDQKRAMTHHPLVRYLRASLDVALHGWRQSTVLELLKCGLCPLETHQADQLENFALRHGIDGDNWLATWNFTSVLEPEDEREERLARREAEENARCSAYRDALVAPLTPLRDLASAGDIPVQTALAAMRALITEGHAASLLANWIASPDVELSRIHSQCRDGLLELLQTAEALFAGRSLPLRSLAMMLLASMETLSVKLAPPTLDQVLVGQVDRSRSPEFTHVVLMGLNEGRFPSAAGEDAIFGDSDRKKLDDAKIEFNLDSTRKAMQERLIGYIALTRSSQTLLLTRPIADESGRKQSESGFVARVKAILSDLSVEPASRGGLADVVTPEQLAGEIAASRRKKTATPDDRAALAWARSSAAPKPFAPVADLVMESTHYANDATLSPELAAQLTGQSLTCSVTRLEKFAMCPFRHFAEHELRLTPREEAEVSNLDLGNAFHAVLDALAQRMIQDRLDWSSEELTAHLEAQIQRVAQELRNCVLIANERNRHILDVIRRMLLKLIADQSLLAKRSMFHVEHSECVFGPDPDATFPSLEITTPKGRHVALRGRIDRIDKRSAGQPETYLIFDYKSRQKKLSLDEVGAGITLQLLIYMAVLRENNRNVDAALYMPLNRPMESASEPKLADPETITCKPRGVISVDGVSRLDPGLAGGSKILSAYIKTDGSPGNENKTDLVTPQDLDGILALVRQNVGELADRVFDGEIVVQPYQLDNKSPCPWCDQRAVCRFDTRYNQYRVITPLGRLAMLAKVNPARQAAKPASDQPKPKSKRKGAKDNA